MAQYIVGNWKMNGTKAEAEALAFTLAAKAKDVSGPLPHVVLCPSYPYLVPVLKILEGSTLESGAQDCSPEANGAFTGDVSVSQLSNIGCTYVIVGHSERRHHHLEPNALIRQKAEAVIRGKLKPIICIGETEEEYRAGKCFSVLSEKLEACLPSSCVHSDILIAYEPVWAIGTGLTPSLEEVEKVMSFLKERLRTHIPEGDLVPTLYGGSVNAANARLFLTLPYVDGLLVGGASLRADDFWHIIMATERQEP
jgi:triosephosphate isomerase